MSAPPAASAPRFRPVARAAIATLALAAVAAIALRAPHEPLAGVPADPAPAQGEGADGSDDGGAPVDLRVIVLGPDGGPAHGARVVLGRESYVAGGEHETTATADARGEAFFEGVATRAHPLRAVAADGAAVTVTTVIAGPGLGSPVVRLEPPGTLEVALAGDPAGRLPLPCGIEAQRDDDLEPLLEKRDVPGGAPTARLTLAAGPWHLALSDENASVLRDGAAREWDVVVPSSGTARVEVCARPLGVVAGTVRAEGRPLPGALVALSFDGAGGISGRALVAADAEGRFRAAALGRTRVEALPEGDLLGDEATLEVAPGEAVERSLELVRAGSIHVHAAYGRGAPASGEAAIFEAGAAGPARTQRLSRESSAPFDGEGQALFTGVRPGRWTVVVEGEHRTVTVTAAQRGEEEIPTAFVDVRVADPEDHSVPSAPPAPEEREALPETATGLLEVSLPADRSTSDVRLAVNDPAGRRVESKRTTKGRVEIRLVPGPYEVAPILELREAGVVGVVRYSPVAFTVTAGATTRVDLQPCRTALLRVSIAPPSPARSAIHIRRVLSSGATTLVASFESQGDEVTARLPVPAAYAVVLRAPRCLPDEVRVSLTSMLDTEAKVTFTARPRPSSWIRFEGGPASAVQVTHQMPGAWVEPLEERSGRAIERIALDPGPVRLAVRLDGDPSGFFRAAADVVVPDEGEVVVPLPRLGRSTLAAFVVAPRGVARVRLEGPAGPVAPARPGRIVWDRLPAGSYRIMAGDRVVAEATLAEGETRDLGVVEGR